MKFGDFPARIEYRRVDEEFEPEHSPCLVDTNLPPPLLEFDRIFVGGLVIRLQTDRKLNEAWNILHFPIPHRIVSRVGLALLIRNWTVKSYNFYHFKHPISETRLLHIHYSIECIGQRSRLGGKALLHISYLYIAPYTRTCQSPANL